MGESIAYEKSMKVIAEVKKVVTGKDDCIKKAFFCDSCQRIYFN